MLKTKRFWLIALFLAIAAFGLAFSGSLFAFGCRTCGGSGLGPGACVNGGDALICIYEPGTGCIDYSSCTY